MKNCPNCAHENLADARFCEECGRPFATIENNNEDNRFCFNCGEAIQPTEHFCSNCGQRLKALDSPTSKIKKALSKNRKIAVRGFILAVVLLISGLLFGRYYYSYPQQLNRLAQTFKTQDPEKIASVVTSEDPNYTVSVAELTKFISYYQESDHKADFADFLTDLKNDPGRLEDFSLHQKGSYLGIFPRYQLVIQPVYLTVTADQSNLQLLLDDKKLATVKSRNYQTTWGPLTPGSYQIKGKLGNEQSVSTQDLVRYHNPDFESDSHVAISLHKISFRVLSTNEGATVLLDDKEVATIQNGQAEIKDVIWHQGMEVRLIFKEGQQQVKSDPYQITAGNYLADAYDANRHESEIRIDIDQAQ